MIYEEIIFWSHLLKKKARLFSFRCTSDWCEIHSLYINTRQSQYQKEGNFTICLYALTHGFPSNFFYLIGNHYHEVFKVFSDLFRNNLLYICRESKLRFSHNITKCLITCPNVFPMLIFYYREGLYAPHNISKGIQYFIITDF